MSDPIDRRQLSEMVQELGPGNVRDLVRSFLDTTPQLIADVRSVASDPEQLRSTAHRLKGGALAIGASALAEVSGRLERGGDVVEGAISELDSAWSSTADALKRFVQS